MNLDFDFLLSDASYNVYLYSLNTATMHLCHLCCAGVIERWELLQAQAHSKEMRMKQNMQQWQQFNSDLNSICSWLDHAEEELEQQRGLDLSMDIQTIELRIKKLKVRRSSAVNHNYSKLTH